MKRLNGFLGVLVILIPLLGLGVVDVGAEPASALPCEVLEAFGPLPAPSGMEGLCGVLLHHANAEDRDELSAWLRARGGQEVEFSFDGQTYQGILLRMAHCFGRGLLLYRGIQVPGYREIIQVRLPGLEEVLTQGGKGL